MSYENAAIIISAIASAPLTGFKEIVMLGAAYLAALAAAHRHEISQRRSTKIEINLAKHAGSVAASSGVVLASDKRKY